MPVETIYRTSKQTVLIFSGYLPARLKPEMHQTEQDKKTVVSSRDTMDSFVNDAARLKAAFDSIVNQKDDDSTPNAEDDLLNSLGCDT